MRTSVIVALLVIGLIGVGLRSKSRQSAPIIGLRAEAQSPPRTKTTSSRQATAKTSAATPSWKVEVTGESQSTANAARQDALRAAGRVLAEHLRERYPGYNYTPTPDFLIDHKLVDDGREESHQLDAPEAPVMIRATYTVELRPSEIDNLLNEDRHLRAEDRLKQAAYILGAIVVVLLVFVGYIRVDEWTKGYFSLALKLTALALAAAALLALVSMA